MLKIPFAIQYDEGRMKERGPYQGNNGPRGAVVHFTAGRFEKGLQSAESTIEGGIGNGYTFLCIARSGELVQAHDVNKYGYHAGESAWKVRLKRLTWGLVGSVSDDLIGIEMNNAGIVYKKGEEFYPYWCFEENNHKKPLRGNAKPIDKKDIRYVTEEIYGCPTAHYHKYSPEQEETLTKTLMWLYVNCPDFKLEYVLGHHEVAGELGIGRWRKNDPGGSLSMPMAHYRDYLIDHKDELIVKFGIKKAR